MSEYAQAEKTMAVEEIAELPMQASRFDGLLVDLEERITSLERHLAPILRQEPPRIDEVHKNADKEISGIALVDSFDNLNDRLFASWKRLIRLDERIAL